MTHQFEEKRLPVVEEINTVMPWSTMD